MKIRYLAHASFLLTADNGTRIITDPYQCGEGLRYAPVTEEADIVTVSHEHSDHNCTETIGGKPQVLREGGAAGGINFKVVLTAHDESGGAERGANRVFVMDIDGMKVVHLGDLGHPLTDEQANEIGKADILLIPIGGFFTINSQIAADNAAKLGAKVVIPMHYKTGCCDLPISGVEVFITGRTNVTKTGTSEISLSRETLPKWQQIMVLEPSH